MNRRPALPLLWTFLLLAGLAWGVCFPSAPMVVAAATPSPSASGQPPKRSVADVLKGVDLSRPDERERVAAEIRSIQDERRQAGIARARELGVPLRLKRPDGTLMEVAGVDDRGRPLYHITHNANAAISTGANLLQAAPYSLNGSGVVIGLWDGGSARSTHQELAGRVTVKDGSGDDDHATHVGGTMIASGVQAAAKGMAPSATIDSYDWNSDYAEMTLRGASAPAQAAAIYLSNHSYGFISGWTPTGILSPQWEWYGTGTTAADREDDFGRYGMEAQEIDAIASSAPYYLIFRSAGNERNDNPSTGDIVDLTPTTPGGSSVSYSSASHPPGDGVYLGGYGTISYDEIAKNIVTVGSVADAVTAGVRDPAKAAMEYYSSWGPTDDGRIKPDLVANGQALYSSLSTNNTAYDSYSGTSMACPNATGTAALLIQRYGQLFPGGAMRSSTLKALLLHTADDLGNTGPDYQFGWGLVNGQASVELIADHAANPAKSRISENLLTSGNTFSHDFAWDGVSPIRITLCWTDPAGTITAIDDDRPPRLVNNLDLKLVAPGGAEYHPYVMPFVGTWTQASLSLPATTGVNNTDNVEQVLLAAPPAPGIYHAVVSHQGALSGGSQRYALILSGSANTVLPLSLNAITPSGGYAGGAVVLADLTGNSLAGATDVRLTRTGQTDIVGTNLQVTGGVLRCRFNLAGAAPGAWNVTVSNATESATLAGGFTVSPALWSENFDGTVSGWTSESIDGAQPWALVTSQSHTPGTAYFIPDPDDKITTRLVSPAITVPAAATNLQLKFRHKYDFEQPDYDGGRLELSNDGGVTWFGVDSAGSGASFTSHGYTGVIAEINNPSIRNSLHGQAAWIGSSGGFVETIIALTDTAKFAGHTVRFRWIMGSDLYAGAPGWYVDSVALTGILPATVTLGDLAQTYDGTPRPVSVTTNPAGLAYSATYDGSATAPTNAGSYAVAATVTTPGYAGSANGTLVVAKAAQTITFAALPAKTYGDAPFALTATASSGLTVGYASSTPAVATVSGNTVTLAGAGTTTITASQAGDGNHLAAANVDRPLTVNPAIYAWRLTHFGTTEPGGDAADDADPDDDGIFNLLEYATGNDPLVPDTAGLPAPGLDVDQHLTLTFQRIADPELFYEVRASDDLVDWNTIWSSVGPANVAGPVTVIDPADPALISRRFLRLQVTR